MIDSESIDKKGLGIGLLILAGISGVGFLIAILWSMPLVETIFAKVDCTNSDNLIDFYGNTTAQKLQTCVAWNHMSNTNSPIFKWTGFVIFVFGIPIAIANMLFRTIQIHRPQEWILEQESKKLKRKGLNPHGTLPKDYKRNTDTQEGSTKT